MHRVQKPSGGHPEWHVLGNVLPLLQGGIFTTLDGKAHKADSWDLVVAHPPCTYLSNVATRHHSLKSASLAKINDRTIKRIEAMQFFMCFVSANSRHIAIENPVGVMNTCYRKPDMIIHPYMFAESVDDAENYCTKATCFWVKDLPELVGTGLPKPDNEKLYGRNPNGKVSNWEEHQTGAKSRSKTFPGIAKAIAAQWSAYILRCDFGGDDDA